MTPERLAAYVFLAPYAFIIIVAVLLIVFISFTNLYELLKGLWSEIYPPEPYQPTLLDNRVVNTEALKGFFK